MVESATVKLRVQIEKLLGAEQLNKTFGMVADQWREHPGVEWRRKWVATAREHGELSNSALVLALEKAGDS